jgi:hypothetical protein
MRDQVMEFYSLPMLFAFGLTTPVDRLKLNRLKEKTGAFTQSQIVWIR